MGKDIIYKSWLKMIWFLKKNLFNKIEMKVEIDLMKIDYFILFIRIYR